MARNERSSHGVNQGRRGQLLALQQKDLYFSGANLSKDISRTTDLNTLLLHDEDLGLYQEELRLAKVSQRYYDLSIDGSRLFSRLGVEDQVSKNIFFGTKDAQFQDRLIEFHMQILPRISTNLLAARQYKDWGKKNSSLSE